MANDSVLVGLECGGTRTVALAADGELRQLARVDAGPANLRLVSDEQLAAHFRAIGAQLPAPSAVGVGMAGVRDRRDCDRVERILEQVWPGVPRRVDHDLESALAAAELAPDRSRGNEAHSFSSQQRLLTSSPTGKKERSLASPAATVIVLSGTGSCCYGRNAAGQVAKVGGWGHHLGDRGSAYDLAHTTLRLMARHLDHTGKLGDFGRRVLRVLLLNEPNDLIAWFQHATKGQVAALAPEVFAAATAGDAIARQALAQTQAELVADATQCAHRLAGKTAAVHFAFAGSVLLKQPAFARRVGSQLRRAFPKATFGPLAHESAWGAVAMARTALESGSSRGNEAHSSSPAKAPPTQLEAGRTAIPVSTALSPTEQRHPRSAQLDRLSTTAAIELMLSEDERIPGVIRSHRVALEKLIGLTTRALRDGGRLFYIGAGTSGRLGVLDASECPPTFRTSPGLVQGIMAGGEKALHSAVEGAEDDFGAGARAAEFRGLGPKDVLVGIAASGRTPFVWGALATAKRRGAQTALLCFNPFLQFARGHRPDVVLALDLGPEVLTGSTRLKAGTATKLVLNLLTTLTMVRLGKVVGNLMVDLNPSNVKLRDRACRIVVELTGRDYATAQRALEESGWVVKAAIKALGRKELSSLIRQ